ncbi:MAG: magnesium-translocating P-type ATPase [Chloroflexi bacterium]|nr:magnesium-translocating P-type ATPase [Chloroflexota bacterium]
MQHETLATLYQRLGSSEQGLTGEEARRRLAQYGPNEAAAVKRSGPIRQILAALANPLVLILLAASIVSAVLGEPLDAVIIVAIIFFSTAIDYYQTHRSQEAAERLRSQVALTATTLRDGKWIETPRREVVAGDVIRLSAGDLVPADARLIQARDLHANQAALTGESMPAEKEAGDSEGATDNPADARNTVFLGSSIVSGAATALVAAIGKDTSFGDIAVRLAARAPETEFDRGIRQFGMFIMRVVLLLVLFVFMVSAALKHDALQSLLFAVSLAVGLTPEFLPMITTVTLAQGAVHMAKRKVIVKNLASIQNFGSMDILCSDKTGTLTSGDMTLDRQVDPAGQPSERVLALAYLNSANETGIKNSLDEAIVKHVAAHPFDAALQQREGLDAQSFQKLDEIPFDFERRRLSIVVGSAARRLMITKGAPEGVIAACTAYEVAEQTHPLDGAGQSLIDKTYQDLSAQGYRVLAVAWREAPEQAVYKIADEKELTLAGFVAFIDPPLEDAAAVLKQLADDGVRVKILTGDGELVAQHTCKQVGLDVGRIVLGEEIARATDAALSQLAEKTVVFARVAPNQKNRIILALKSRGHVVGYMGDGINDTPSLHNADVGISVSTAVDVAKGAADIILLERSLRVLHAGILEGRKAFGNVMKYLLMGTSSNFGNMFSMAGASLFLPFLPMLPTQILLNNFLYDLAQITIPSDNVDESYMHKPRKWNIDIIRDFMLLIGPISSIYDFLTFAVMLFVFHAGEDLFHTGWFVESLATQTLVLFVIRTVGNPFKSRPSRPLTVTTLLIVLVGLLLPFTPLAGALGFTPLPATYFIFLVAATSTYLLLVEFAKRRLMRRMLG